MSENNVPANFRGINLTGQSFARLTVLHLSETRGKDRGRYWVCQCSCGNQCEVLGSRLTGGNTRSCGCLKRELSAERGSVRFAANNTTHGMSGTRVHVIWKHVVGRCTNLRNAKYPDYGGRGITICDRWRNSFSDFYSDMGECPAGCSIDRIDNDGNYEPSNCRWATGCEQQRNKRNNVKITANSETLTAPEWSERTNIKAATILARIRAGWSPERAVGTPTK